MIDQELSMVHSGEHLNVSVGVEGAQVPGLRFGHEGLSGSVPKMDISPLNGLQFVGINILVSDAPPLLNKTGSRKRLPKVLFSSGGRTRTCDLRVMSPTSYRLLYPAMFGTAKVDKFFKSTK